MRHAYHGFINLHKPLGITSADAVNRVKRLIRPTKIGHAGTLDPLATGVLPLALGEGTKCINLLMDARKTYDFTVTFGEARATDDAEGAVVATCDHRPTDKEIGAILPRFTGRISQTPPIYSALKVAGRRAYDLARAGEEVVLAAREVVVYGLEVVRVQSPEYRVQGLEASVSSSLNSELWTLNSTTFRATVSKGTYIRSLGRDMAQALGTVGYISHLHRVAVGPFCDTDAISLDFLEESVHKAPPLTGDPRWLTPLERALDDIPALSVDGGQLAKLRQGQRVMLVPPMPDVPQIAVLHQGKLMGLARGERGELIPVRLLVRN